MMLLSLTLVVILLIPKLAQSAVHPKLDHDVYNYHVVELTKDASLDDVTSSLGAETVTVGPVGELQNVWLLRSPKPSDAELVNRGLEHDPVMETYERLRGRATSQLSPRSEQDLRARAVVDSISHISRQVLQQRSKRAPPPIMRPITSDKVAERFGIKDPLFPDQWHLVNDEHPQHMLNVVPVWEMGFTGKGVISAVVDDGLDFTNEDLAPNFDAVNSHDFNDHEDLPVPKNSNDKHGTRCAGQIAAAKNDVCGIGIAHDSKVAGIRILSKPIVDVDEAVALNYGYQNISVYSCSWGPPDNGRAMGHPSYLIRKAVLNGINNGRGGKGSIFVFASGNGGHHEDQCNYDGYTNSIYSVTVSAVDHTGKHPGYSEACAANMITSYSSGSSKYIVTTDRGKKACATTHGGTSAAAPNVAGVFVLAVQARPELTWRDFQYLCIETAKMIHPDDPDWETTAIGRKYSYKYGYGVLDAYEFIVAAQKWTLVKPQAWFESPVIQLEGGKMDVSKNFTGGTHIGPGGVTSTLTITQDMLIKNNFESLEHVTIQVWVNHSRRGDVEFELVSPRGIKSVLGNKRSGDDSKKAFPGWVFMSVKHWGEDPTGEWTMKISDQQTPKESGQFLGWRMRFWGATIDPLKAEKYVLPVVDNVLPPSNDPARPVIDSPPITNEHSKPTAFLPHPTGTGDDSFVSDIEYVVAKHKVFFGGVGVVFLAGLLGCAIFLKRRQGRTKNYTPLSGDAHRMATLNGGYGSEPEVVGEPSAGRHPQDRAAVGLGFHSSFLDDDELSTAGTGHTTKYRDEPEESHPVPPTSNKSIIQSTDHQLTSHP